MTHRIYLPGVDPAIGTRVPIEGPEAHHAVRVKRLSAGDDLELLNGAGLVARARIISAPGAAKDRTPVVVEIDQVTTVPQVYPRVEVCCALPKDARVADLIDGLCQVGAASLTPLRTERSIAPRKDRSERLDRIAVEAAKQCGRAWMLQFGDAMSLEQALGLPGERVLAHPGESALRTRATGPVRLLIGPEGGWSPRELAMARESGALLSGFGPHAMRIETAAIVACAAIILFHA